MDNKLSVPELIKALRFCSHNKLSKGKILFANKVCLQAADALEQLNDFQNSQLAKALAENTRLAKELDAERQRRKHDA